jgi:autotransporter passenger strand-loop-strand repeat protein
MTEITSGVTSSGLIIQNGETLTVDAGGTALATHIAKGGSSVVSGLTSGDIIAGSGTETVIDGGVASGATVSGSLVVSAGGLSVGANVTEFGKLSDAGTVSGGSVHGASELNILRGGVAIGVEDLRNVTVEAGGSGHAITVSRTSRLIIARFGVVTSDTVSKGASEVVSGAANHTKIMSGGEQEVLGHGVAQGTVVSSGGKLLVSGAGVARNAIVEGGGFISGAVDGLTVVDQNPSLVTKVEGEISGIVQLKGGTTRLSGVVASGATVSFLTGWSDTLQIAQGATVDGLIKGFHFAHNIDLMGFAFGAGETASWAQSGTSGTLTIKDGAKVEALTVAGSYVTSQFRLSTDSAGGTLIHVVTPAPTPTLFAQAIAGHYSGRAADATMVHGGGAAQPVAQLAVATSGRA